MSAGFFFFCLFLTSQTIGWFLWEKRNICAHFDRWAKGRLRLTHATCYDRTPTQNLWYRDKRLWSTTFDRRIRRKSCRLVRRSICMRVSESDCTVTSAGSLPLDQLGNSTKERAWGGFDALQRRWRARLAYNVFME